MKPFASALMGIKENKTLAFCILGEWSTSALPDYNSLFILIIPNCPKLAF